MARKKNAGAKRPRDSDGASSWRKQIQDWFSWFSQTMAWVTGRPGTFLLAVTVIVIWAVTGPLFGFSDTWQLVINTGTTIVTFLMVFLIQNTQNRDTEALQVKLDELIRVTKGAHNALMDLEELDEKELDRICESYQEIAKQAREEARRGGSDTDVPEIEDVKGKP